MTVSTHEPKTAEWFPGIEDERKDVLFQLERITASPLFCNSKRYPMFLRYIVERTLDGTAEALKERTVGVEVFERLPDYDTNTDNIVRITAGEVRRRIAQYYHGPGHENELRIDLPSGSYTAHFTLGAGHDSVSEPISRLSQLSPTLATEDMSMIQSSDIAQDEPNVFVPPIVQTREQYAPKNRRGLIWSTLILAGTLVAVAGWWLVHPRYSQLDLVWNPLLSTASPVLVSVGEPSLLFATEPATNVPPLSIGQHLHQTDYMALPDVKALSRITQLLDARSHPYRLAGADETSFADLRQGPAILLGGFDNPWTIRALASTRFTLKSNGSGLCWIEDRLHPETKAWIVDFHQQYAKLTADYAIVARFYDPQTQQPVMVIAGVGVSGNKAASEFLTESENVRSLGLEPVGRNASNGVGDAGKWTGRNVEVVIATQVINGISGAPKVIAKEVW